MRYIKKIFFALAICFSVLGCSPTDIIGPAIQAYIMWKNGEGHMYFKTDRETAFEALKRTLVELNYDIADISTDRNGDYQLIATNRSRFKIKVTQVTNEITSVSIRVNFMGDKDYANLIYDSLSKQMNVIDFNTIK